MYDNIFVAVDNSVFSGYAESIGLRIALAGKIPVTGVHAYTGRFHQARFRALEGHLPEKYRTEEELSHQRDIHSVLIGRGLELISTEYMKRLDDACRAAGIPFFERVVDGKNADVVIDASQSGSLTVIGAEGLGHIDGISGLGSTARRTIRHGRGDILIAKKGSSLRSVLAGVDGSEEAFMMIKTASVLSCLLGATLTIAACFDPGLHRTVFGSLSSTLSKEAGDVFKFSEQEELHNEIIDRSLADLYSRHLERAAKIASEHGAAAGTRLVQGKPFCELCKLADELGSDLIVVGHSGMHRSIYGDIGSNTERVAELAGTNVLIVGDNSCEDYAFCGEREVPVPGSEGDPGMQFDKPLIWDADAKERIEKVPSIARSMAVIAIERYAKENGISTITPEVMNSAREELGL